MKKPVTGVSAIPTAHGHGIGTTTPDWEDHGTKTMGQPWVEIVKKPTMGGKMGGKMDL